MGDNPLSKKLNMTDTILVWAEFDTQKLAQRKRIASTHIYCPKKLYLVDVKL